MKNRKLLAGIAAAVGMMILILDGKTALHGAAEGIELCIRTVVPSLFPFFILSIGLVGSWTGLTIPPLRAVGKLLHMPPGLESLLIPGFLGGYPVGAQAIAECYRRNQVTASTAEKLTSFCNNAGPAFIFGIIGQFFPDVRYCWILWGVHIASAVLIAATLPKFEHSESSKIPVKALTLSEIMNRSLRAMATVCGWVILFRVILSFLDRWILWLLPVPLRPLVIGVIELTNGCCSLGDTTHVGLRLIIASAILSFGGLSVWMQTASVLSGLSVKRFVVGKLKQTLFSVILTISIQPFLPKAYRYVQDLQVILVSVAVGMAGLCFHRICGIRCSNPKKTIV